jgi:modulator of FtsH protease
VIPDGWDNFFVAQVGASAALIGLLFVSLSINLQRIIAYPYLVDRVGEAILTFLGPFLISIFGLVPRESLTTFGLQVLEVGGVIWLFTTTLQARRFRMRPPEATLAGAVPWIAVVQAATLSTVVAGLLLATGRHAGFGWLVLAIVSSYLAGITSVWVLTVEILR